MAEQRVAEKENKGIEGSQYAHTDEELYRKAIGLLDKCRIFDSRR
jgi:hypothetical protein